MGWISLSRCPKQPPILSPPEKLEAYVEHTEDISSPNPPKVEQAEPTIPFKPHQPSFLGKPYPFQHPSTPDSDLPFIDPSIVTLVEKAWRKLNASPIVDRSKSKPNSESPRKPECEGGIPAWIVIDNIIYDCTTFQSEHPGGSAVIRNFVGQDCSWQFRRFHSQHQLVAYGGALRVGRTKGVVNRYKEVPRFVGASSVDDDYEW
ncbi:hypothetical protein BDW69DRAFT_200220 [Aspergillus filifer]